MSLRSILSGINSKLKHPLEQNYDQANEIFHCCNEGCLSPVNVFAQDSPWANLPPELLLDIMGRIEASETTWPARRTVLFCAAVCKSWRKITKEVIRTPEECGILTFPMSIKQVKTNSFVLVITCTSSNDPLLIS